MPSLPRQRRRSLLRRTPAVSLFFIFLCAKTTFFFVAKCDIAEAASVDALQISSDRSAPNISRQKYDSLETAGRLLVERRSFASENSLKYWNERRVEDGDDEPEDRIVEVEQSIVEGHEGAAAVDTSDLQDVARILATTERPKVVENAHVFKEKRFALFSAGLRSSSASPNANTFRSVAPHRVARYEFRAGGIKEPHGGSRDATAKLLDVESRTIMSLEGIELRSAARGLFTTKVSAVVKQDKAGSPAQAPLANAPGRHQARDRASSYQMIDGFVAEVDKVYEEELEHRLAWELRIWRYLPSHRAEHLAAHEHILIPGAVLEHAGPPGVSSRLHGAGRKEAAGVRGHDEKWTDLLSEKVFNVFIWYPAGYRDTLESSMMHSDQVTEPWFSSTPLHVLESISTQMILAVANLNSYGLVHTHLRSASFVFTPEGKVLLSDLNRVVKQGEFMDCAADRELALNDLTASPEERVCVHEHGYKGRDAKQKEDIVGPLEAQPTVDAWRLAVLLYQLWCMESMYARTSYHEFVARHDLLRLPDTESNIAHLRQNRFPLGACRKDMPASLQRIVRQMLVPDPAKRVTAAESVKTSSFFHETKRKQLLNRKRTPQQRAHQN
ncbi:rhoptry kinase family protein ROP22 (incomplete catalytic triad) [Besnoitia besnoiti]|uniref:Rhoptry kinase family protein ROP22 (Incomplete catalytic triad) n=1 Tax=Besnoitia besnoiti TaxID=94643 RepID=A0A2A9LZC7_BESBE|nr:rhoptry kinase family protein ROP22 (incomplete catalytic triad) [Besnoitia besnoiti]PFH31748.1 rhoptry kinase family protein ROP22 (incomplete catalytic triad) [Besnoitia besnoiti]